MRKIIRKWLGLDTTDYRIETLENLLLDQQQKLNGFAVLKVNKSLNPTD